jgi:hypothetical protein
LLLFVVVVVVVVEEEIEEVETPSARAKKLFWRTPSASCATNRVGCTGPEENCSAFSFSLDEFVDKEEEEEEEE